MVFFFIKETFNGSERDNVKMKPRVIVFIMMKAGNENLQGFRFVLDNGNFVDFLHFPERKLEGDFLFIVSPFCQKREETIRNPTEDFLAHEKRIFSSGMC